MSTNFSGAGTVLPIAGFEKGVEFFQLRDIDMQTLEQDERIKHIRAAIQAAQEANCDAEEVGRATQGAVEACRDFDFLGVWGKLQMRKPQFLARIVQKSSRDVLSFDQAMNLIQDEAMNGLVIYLAFGKFLGLSDPRLKPKEKAEGEQHPIQESQSTQS